MKDSRVKNLLMQQKQQQYKIIQYSYDGGIDIGINDPKTGQYICNESYHPDGSLESSVIFRKMPDGKYTPSRTENPPSK